MIYLLGDGIYPDWPLFSNPIHHPENETEQMYKNRLEAIRNDFERGFEVLQSWLEIIRRKNRCWNKDEAVRIIKVCGISHNMIISMIERGEFGDDEDDENVLLELFEKERDLKNSVNGAPDARSISKTGGEMDLGEFCEYDERMMTK